MDNLVIEFLPPPTLDGYDPFRPPHEQFDVAPPLFAAAMAVRQEVFVQEQNIPPDGELDDEDVRSCHWVAFLQSADEDKDRDPATSNSKWPGEVVGTLRIVPYPRPPHPGPGYVYATVDGAFTLCGRQTVTASGEVEIVPLSEAEMAKNQVTSLHDGKELYVNLGRMAVRKKFRGLGYAQELVKAALDWMAAHPNYFDAKEASKGKGDKEDEEDKGEKFQGLVCVHGQIQALRFWKGVGFVVDEAMGEWIDEGIRHVGMFRRLDVAESGVDTKSK